MRTGLLVVASVLCTAAIDAQTVRYRGAPDPLVVDWIIGADPRGHDRGVVIASVLEPVIAAENGAVPDGIEALPVDIFTTTDFYADTGLWHDPRYYRCNSPTALESLGGATRMSVMGEDPPRTAAWGYCDRDYPRDEIASPYPFDTAKAHYEALLDEAVGRGGPTQYTQSTLPDWNGEALITWTSNIQGWISHGIHEYSSRLQTIEVYTPRRDDNGGLIGLKHELVLYDDEAFVEPVRVVQWLDRIRDLNAGEPIPTDECIPVTFPIEGVALPVYPGQTIEFVVPDIYGRPWDKIWEMYHEQGMSRPAEPDLFDFGP